GVQALGLHERLELVVLGAHRGLGADPLGLALDGGLRVAGLDAQHAAAFGCDGHTASLVRVAGEPGRRPAAGAVSARISDSADSRHETTVGTTSAMVTSCPSSAVRLVTSASSMPHGTMRSNSARSGLQLRAKPCMVTPLATRTPMAQILRSRRAPSAGSHTPERFSTRTVSRPNAAQASMIACSSWRTYFTTSMGSARRTMG